MTTPEIWKAELARWALPDDIIAQAEQPPFAHPVSMFVASDEIPDSPSHQIAREALPEGGSVLDVGSGGGRAAFALVPPAGSVIGVDHQQGMLDEFAAAAQRRGIAHQEFLGDWPDVAGDVPEADVVVCHHVAYNVADIVPFLTALDAHARRRVVIELPLQHPLTHLNPLWKQFWDLDRPDRPTAHDLHAIARDLGLPAVLKVWIDESWGKRAPISDEDRVRFTRIRLCLPEDREEDVARALAASDDAAPRTVTTLWWDVD